MKVNKNSLKILLADGYSVSRNGFKSLIAETSSYKYAFFDTENADSFLLIYKYN